MRDNNTVYCVQPSLGAMKWHSWLKYCELGLICTPLRILPHWWQACIQRDCPRSWWQLLLEKSDKKTLDLPMGYDHNGYNAGSREESRKVKSFSFCKNPSGDLCNTCLAPCDCEFASAQRRHVLRPFPFKVVSHVEVRPVRRPSLVFLHQ